MFCLASFQPHHQINVSDKLHSLAALAVSIISGIFIFFSEILPEF